MKQRLKALWSDLRRNKLGSLAVTGIALLLSAVGVGLQLYYLYYEYDVSYHVYSYGSHAMTVLLLLLGIGIAVLLATLLLPKGQFETPVPRTHASVRAMNAACGVACLYVAVACFSLYGELFSHPVPMILTQLLCVASALYFFAEVKETPPALPLRCGGGFAVVLLLVLRIFSLYFEQTRPIVSPLKSLELIGVFALTLYFLTELRQWLGLALPRLQQVLNGIALIALGMSSVASLLLYFANSQSYGAFTVFAVFETVLFCRLALERVCALLPREWDELLNYLVFGVLTTVVNLVAFFLLTRTLGMEVLLANILAWIVGVLFAYAVNKFLVFEVKGSTGKQLLTELGLFTAARLFSLGAEELILFIGVYLLAGKDIVAKIVAAVVVIVLNYIASKFLIFRKKKPTENEKSDA